MVVTVLANLQPSQRYSAAVDGFSVELAPRGESGSKTEALTPEQQAIAARMPGFGAKIAFWDLSVPDPEPAKQPTTDKKAGGK